VGRNVQAFRGCPAGADAHAEKIQNATLNESRGALIATRENVGSIRCSQWFLYSDEPRVRGCTIRGLLSPSSCTSPADQVG